MKSAYQTGFDDATLRHPMRRGRAYESDKANKAYYQGYADGMKALHPELAVAQCQRDGTIFSALPEPYILPSGPTEYVECGTCGRRYFKEGDKWVSDRELKVIHA